jgi:hypothetical protein
MWWANDGQHSLKGLMKFALDLLPQNPFKHLLNLKLGIRYKAPIVDFKDLDSKFSKKYVPIIFSHGIGCSMTFFSSFCKELAS